MGYQDERELEIKNKKDFCEERGCWGVVFLAVVLVLGFVVGVISVVIDIHWVFVEKRLLKRGKEF